MDFDVQAIKDKKTQWDAETLSTTRPHNHHTHTHPFHLHPRDTLKSLTLNTWSSAKACLVFPNCKHVKGRRTKGSAARTKGTRGWVETMLCGTWTSSNLEIFFWPRVKWMILLCDESLEDALHDRKKKVEETSERREDALDKLPTGVPRHSRSPRVSLCPIFLQHAAFFLGLIW